uniref:ATP synthase complex subunit 8 n=1 Tax=Macrophthalmus abbreviatus TaxID=220121 RepID=A0A891GZM1_9EUCA|nr:ATP synthase F0 subunit 8 [Macrophthalmus abbreviatus]QRK27322.1 ATP synthase F0 subunit 8 [Macrophthalmus abbreviatus]
MPQMAPILWLPMFFFFLFFLFLFISLNFFIKPFNKIQVSSSSTPPTYKPWSL